MAADIEEVTAEVAGNVQRVCAAWHVVAGEQLQAVESVHADGYLVFAAAPLLRSWSIAPASGGSSTAQQRRPEQRARGWLRSCRTARTASPTITAATRRRLLAGAPGRLEDLCERTLPNLFDGEQPERSGGRTSDWTFLGQRWGSNTQLAEDFFDRRVHPRWGPKTSGRVQYRVATMFSHPSTTATFAHADQEPGGADFNWDWDHVRTRVISALACSQVGTLDLYDYLGWRQPELATWNDQLARFVMDTKPRSPDAAA